jgi:hypothetical protein
MALKTVVEKLDCAGILVDDDCYLLRECSVTFPKGLLNNPHGDGTFFFSKETVTFKAKISPYCWKYLEKANKRQEPLIVFADGLSCCGRIKNVRALKSSIVKLSLELGSIYDTTLTKTKKTRK